jgi:DNA polymerase/3'-5' exonuclease PolX
VENRTIAQRLTRYAHHLETQRENLYRIRAYRRAAETILRLDRPVAELVAREGRAGLEALPGIGEHLSFTIEALVVTGEFRTLREAREPPLRAERRG